MTVKLLQEGTVMTTNDNLLTLSVLQLLAAFLRTFFLFLLALSAKGKKNWLRIRMYPLPSLRCLETKT